jgi:hypothetical protein
MAKSDRFPHLHTPPGLETVWYDSVICRQGKKCKKHGVAQPRWAIWREIWKLSCLLSLLDCISRKTVDTEYMYYSWCMMSTDIVKWRKNERLWKFWDLYENFEKRGVLEKRGGGSEIHASYLAPYRSPRLGNPVFFTLFTLSTYDTVVSNCF